MLSTRSPRPYPFPISVLNLVNGALNQGAKMHLQRLSIQQDYTLNLEAFTQAALILFLGVAIVTSNALIIATIINFRGLYKQIQLIYQPYG